MRRFKQWWSERKTWQKVVLVVIGLAVVFGPFTGDDQSASETVAAETTTTIVEEEVTTTEIPTTTTTMLTTTTTIQPTTTSTFSASEGIELYAAVFENQRVELAQIIEDGLFHIESVDSISYEPSGDEAILFMSATSAFPSLLPEDLPDDGWDVMQLWEAYWEGLVADGQEAVVPIHVIELSGHTFECPAQFVLDMIDLRASQSDFVETCIG